MPTSFSSMLSSVASFANGLVTIVTGMQNVANQIEPIFLCVAFVLLVFGTMRGFMQNDLRQFFGNLVRVIILVALIGNWTLVTGIVSNAVNAVCSLQISANFGVLTNNQTMTTSARMDIGQLTQLLQAKAAGSTTTSAQGQTPPSANSQGQSPGGLQAFLNSFNPVNQVQQAGQALWQNALSSMTHTLCAVLYTIFLLALLLCELIVVLMEVLQSCILVFLGLYVPIGFAEFSIPSLRGQAEAFFKTYIGVQCWPIGWVFVNVVTIALCQNLIAPNQENLGQLLMAILWCVPVLLWVVIGHVLAPFYTQKIVTRGGAELQGFVGAMISAVGGSTGSVYGAGFSFGRWGVQKLNHMGQSKNHGRGWEHAGSKSAHDSSGPEDGSGDWHGLGAEKFLSDSKPKANANEGGALAQVTRLGGKGIGKLWDTGEFGVRTAGSMANTLGALVADASGNRVGPERNFSFPQFPGKKQNRSSQRATSYVTYQDSQN
jgi:hypothetical protein